MTCQWLLALPVAALGSLSPTLAISYPVRLTHVAPLTSKPANMPNGTISTGLADRCDGQDAGPVRGQASPAGALPGTSPRVPDLISDG